MTENGLDFNFLRYIGVEPETQRRIQEFYLPWFKGAGRVVDLACGDGDFVALLQKQGISAIGVDSDPLACAAARERGLEIACQDVFDFLEAAPPGSCDGVFSAHLVEHLDYRQVLRLVRLSWRALRPGGAIVLATPNVRGLYTHLESFYLHFGHVSFYHPDLLCFFLAQGGFIQWEWGENPHTAAPLWGQPDLLGPQPEILPPATQLPPEYPPGPGQVTFRRELPSHAPGLIGQIIGRVKRALTTWLVLPYLDEIVARLNQELAESTDRSNSLSARIGHLDGTQRHLAARLEAIMARLDRPVECYATAIRPPTEGPQPERQQRG